MPCFALRLLAVLPRSCWASAWIPAYLPKKPVAGGLFESHSPWASMVVINLSYWPRKKPQQQRPIYCLTKSQVIPLANPWDYAKHCSPSEGTGRARLDLSWTEPIWPEEGREHPSWPHERDSMKCRCPVGMTLFSHHLKAFHAACLQIPSPPGCSLSGFQRVSGAFGE
jgi:hypothetical protein